MTQAEITENTLQSLVTVFYAKVREDAALGPIFNGGIDDWPEHLQKLQAFWSSVMLGSGRYKGQPMPAHIRHAAQITPETFQRWLALWKEASDALLQPDAAAAIQAKAARIAESLSLGIDFHRSRSAAAA
jgi:hemoglobin